MPVRALIFDFDGLILDTETPEVEVWRSIFAEHGHEYPLELWSQTIGGWGNSDFDPAAALQQMSAGALDLEGLRGRHRQESNVRILQAPILAGVLETLAAARQLALRCAIASSSERAWVEPHLRRLGLLANFEQIITGDDVEKGRTKPHPDLYLNALSALRLEPDEVLVFEDSPNGVRAAHAAGLKVVGVPNPVTAELEMDAELVLGSLDELPLDEILKRVDGTQGRPGMGRALSNSAA